MANTRMTLVVRKDLQLPAGLLASQATHMAMGFIQDEVKNGDLNMVHIPVSTTQRDWIKDPYISILAVNCFEDLISIIKDAHDKGLPTFIWDDTIPSPTFEGDYMYAKVGVAIGPADFDKIKIVTGKLSLY